MTVVFLNFSNGANPPRSERFFSRAVRVFLPLYFTSTAFVRDFFFIFFFSNSFPTKLRAGRMAREESLKWKIPVPRSQDLSSLTLKPCNLLPDLTIFLNFLSERPWQRTQILVHSWGPSILDSSAYGFGNVPVSSGKLCACVVKIWLFGPHSACSLIQPKLFASFISTSSRKSCAASVLELKKFS